MLCSELLWDAEVVARKQVPTIQDAFVCCDAKTLLHIVEQFYAARLPKWGSASPQQRRIARKRMASALEAMRQCRIKRKEGKSYCVFPDEKFVVNVARGQCSIERVLCARIARIAAIRNSQEASMEERETLSFDRLPWAVALSYRIWLEGPWDCQERYLVLANVFWRLTHQGFDEAVRRPSEASYRCEQDYLSLIRSDALCGQKGKDVAHQPAGVNGHAQPASVADVHDSRASAMGLNVLDVLEETYQERLISRVARINEAGEQDFQARVLRFSERLSAA